MSEAEQTVETPEPTIEEFVAEMQAEETGEAESSETPTEQPAEAEAEQEQTFEVQGQQLTIDELKKGYMQESDYTRGKQELARMREEAEAMKAAVDRFYETPAAPEWTPQPPQGGEQPGLPEFTTPFEKELWDKNQQTEQKVEAILEYQKRQATEGRVREVNQTLDGFISAHPELDESQVVEISRTVRTKGMQYSPESFELVRAAVASPDAESIKAAAVAEYIEQQKRVKAKGDAAALEPGTAPAHAEAPPNIADMPQEQIDALMAEEFRQMGG